jgi:lipopolysaccharide transport system permease protein
MREQIVAIYTPESSLASPGKMIRDMFRDLNASRELSWCLASRDLHAQYRKAFFGFFWVLVLPLANTVTWIFLSFSGVVFVGETNLPYPAYAFSGTMLWAIFIDAVNAPLLGTMSSQNILAKINFPREAIVISGVYQTLFNSAIKGGLLLISLPFFGIAFGWHLLLFPFALLSLIIVGTTIGLLITPVGLLYTDVGKGMAVLMQFLMYLSPTIFAMPSEGCAATLFLLNPVTPVIVTARDWLAGSAPEYLGHFLVVNAVSLLLLLLVWVVYRLAMPILIERMSA